MSSRSRARWRLLSCCLLLTLTACGNKGPLYLPDAPGAARLADHTAPARP